MRITERQIRNQIKKMILAEASQPVLLTEVSETAMAQIVKNAFQGASLGRTPAEVRAFQTSLQRLATGGGPNAARALSALRAGGQSMASLNSAVASHGAMAVRGAGTVANVAAGQGARTAAVTGGRITAQAVGTAITSAGPSSTALATTGGTTALTTTTGGQLVVAGGGGAGAGGGAGGTAAAAAGGVTVASVAAVTAAFVGGYVVGSVINNWMSAVEDTCEKKIQGQAERMFEAGIWGQGSGLLQSWDTTDPGEFLDLATKNGFKGLKPEQATCRQVVMIVFAALNSKDGSVQATASASVEGNMVNDLFRHKYLDRSAWLVALARQAAKGDVELRQAARELEQKRIQAILAGGGGGGATPPAPVKKKRPARNFEL
jgi:hypothetical protein